MFSREFVLIRIILTKPARYMYAVKFKTSIFTKQTQLCIKSENSPTTADDR